jgi:hypothetical protein
VSSQTVTHAGGRSAPKRHRSAWWSLTTIRSSDAAPSVLEEAADIEVVGEARRRLAALRVANETDPDVVPLDVVVAVIDRLQLARLLSRRARVLTLTHVHEADLAIEALCAVASDHIEVGQFELDELAAGYVDSSADSTRALECAGFAGQPNSVHKSTAPTREPAIAGGSPIGARCSSHQRALASWGGATSGPWRSQRHQPRRWRMSHVTMPGLNANHTPPGRAHCSVSTAPRRP